MDIEALRKTLRLQYEYPGIEERWRASQETYVDQSDKFLDDDYLYESFQFAGIPAPMQKSFRRAANTICENEMLKRLFWHTHRELFIEERAAAAKKITPLPEWAMGKDAALFAALVVLSSIGRLKDIHAHRNIPEQYTKAAYRDLTIWTLDHQKKNSNLGFSNMGWLLNPFRKKLFRIGRLQFMPTAFSQPFQIFEKVKSKDVIIIPENNLEFNKLGHREGVNGAVNSSESWLSNITIKNKILTSNCMIKKGIAKHGEITIDLREWESSFDRDSTVLDVHIPEDGPLDNDACLDDYASAILFFKQYFPEFKIKGFKCTSWLLDYQFQSLLSEQSNIVQFQNNFHLFPTLEGEKQTIERVFDSVPLDEHTVPRKSRLQKSLLEHHKGGGRFYSGGGVFLAEHLIKD